MTRYATQLAVSYAQQSMASKSKEKNNGSQASTGSSSDSASAGGAIPPDDNDKKKKESKSGKSDRHGDSKAMDKAQKQIDQLEK